MTRFLRHIIRPVVGVILLFAIGLAVAGVVLKIRYDSVTPCGVLRAQMHEATVNDKTPGVILTRVLIDRVTARSSAGECAERVWLLWTE